MHIAFNMIGLFFFGPMVESALGARRYLAFYLLSGVGGGLGYLLLFATHSLGIEAYTPLIGASAGIYGVLVAAMFIAPDVQVMLMFPPIPMKLKTLVLVYIGIAVYTIITQGDNAGGQAAHLGGAAVAFLLMRVPRLLDWTEQIGRPGIRYGGRRVRLKNRSDPWIR